MAQRALYKILQANGEMKSGKLFEEYSRSTDEPIHERAYRENMGKLAELGLVFSKGDGKSRSYSIKALTANR